MTKLPPINTYQRVKLRAATFLMLDEAGTFDGFRKAELIDGEVYGTNAQHRPHARIKGEFYFRLRLALEERGSDHRGKRWARRA